MKTKKTTKARKSNPLQLILPFLEDPKVTEILINGHEQFQVARNGRLIEVATPFKKEEQLVATSISLPFRAT